MVYLSVFIRMVSGIEIQYNLLGQSVHVNVEEKIMLEEKVYRAVVFRFEADAGTSIRGI